MKLKKHISGLLVCLALTGSIHAQDLNTCGTNIPVGTFIGRFVSYQVDAVAGTPQTVNSQTYGFVPTNSPTLLYCVDVLRSASVVRQYSYTAFVLGLEARIVTQSNAGGMPHITDIRVRGH